MNNSATVKNSWARVRDLYHGLALPTRMILVLGTAIVAGLLGYWTLFPPTLDTVSLLGGHEFNAAQIQSISRSFEIEGLTEFRVDGTRVRIPREHVAKYAAAISKHQALPDGLYSEFDKVAEQSSMWNTGAQEERRWGLAKQKMLAQTIELMPEVATASVIIDRSAPSGLRSQTEVRATVTIKPKPGRDLSALTIRKIRAILVGSVANLQLENVAVVDLDGRVFLAIGSPDSGSDDLLVKVKEWEENFTWKIRNVLAYIPDVVVTVNVELDTTLQRRTEQVVMRTVHEKATESRKQEFGSAPAATANAAVDLEPPDNLRPQPDPQPTQQQTWEEHVPLAPKSVTVAIAVPQDVVASLAHSTAANDAEKETWKSAIQDRTASAIPVGVTTKITVTSFPRSSDRAATPVSTATAGLKPGWLPWSVAASIGIILAITLAMGRVRPHKSKKSPEVTRLRIANSDDSADDLNTNESTIAGRRQELVRVERTPATRGRGPHLIQATISSFEDLRWLAPSSLQAVLGAVDSRLWAPALRGASRELCEQILTHLPARAAMLLRDEIEFPGPVRLGDVETAQQEIMEVVRRLDHTGDLVLEDRAEVRHE